MEGRCCITNGSKQKARSKGVKLQMEGERRWFLLRIPRCDTDGGCSTEVTVTSVLIDVTTWSVIERDVGLYQKDRDAT